MESWYVLSHAIILTIHKSISKISLLTRIEINSCRDWKKWKFLKIIEPTISFLFFFPIYVSHTHLLWTKSLFQVNGEVKKPDLPPPTSGRRHLRRKKFSRKLVAESWREYRVFTRELRLGPELLSRLAGLM